MYCKLLRCVVWFVGLASRFELPQSQSSDPDVDLNGSFANSWAVFVSTSFCSQGGLKTKRGKTSFRLALHVCPRVIREDGRHGRFLSLCAGRGEHGADAAFRAPLSEGLCIISQTPSYEHSHFPLRQKTVAFSLPHRSPQSLYRVVLLVVFVLVLVTHAMTAAIHKAIAAEP
ncbi:unnamed protein product [Prorocentrum cordatum]|uniref:Secreted protein n=1 Tax=Prorocentrum cordatum TaxID=2364126 RepID=A0ABN9SDH8_9DINO|nr:unnamed protein product [Polarella glacialis]